MRSVSIETVPSKAIVRVAWMRSEKWRRYHVATPHTATATHKAYQVAG